MQTTEQPATEKTEEGEFYRLLFDEMDRHYATSAPVLPIRPEPEPDYHINPPID